MDGNLPPVVVMGVCGCGKSVVGAALAERLGATFIEGDQLHPAANVAKMAGGTPLDDSDRAGWLAAVGMAIREQAVEGSDVVGACSALKRRYRDQLRAAEPTLAFIHLALDPDTARSRMLARKGHFMPASLVESQFAALEPPQPDELAVTLDARRPIHELVAEAADFLSRTRSGTQAARDRSAQARR